MGKHTEPFVMICERRDCYWSFSMPLCVSVCICLYESCILLHFPWETLWSHFCLFETDEVYRSRVWHTKKEPSPFWRTVSRGGEITRACMMRDRELCHGGAGSCISTPTSAVGSDLLYIKGLRLTLLFSGINPSDSTEHRRRRGYSEN